MKKTKAPQNQTAESQRWRGKNLKNSQRKKGTLLTEEKRHITYRGKKDKDERRFLIENVVSKKMVEQCH